MDNDYLKTIEEFYKTDASKKLIINSIKEISPISIKNFAFWFCFIISSIFSFIISTSNNTVDLFLKITDTMLTAQLNIFGYLFAVYSILLAFLNDSYMKRLSQIDYDQSTSMLKKSTTYYESILFLFFINIGVSGILKLLMNCTPLNFRLTTNLKLDIFLSFLGLLAYFWYSFRVFYELKSTIYNTIILFRASIAYKFIDFSNEVNKKKEDN